MAPADARGNKSKKLVSAPIPDWLFERVFLPRHAAGGDSPWVIQSPRYGGRPLVSVKGSFEALCGETGIRVGMHDLRRTFATIAQAALRDVLMVGRLLTHASKAGANEAAVTAGYVIPEEDDIRVAAN
jgi:integrase